MLAIICKDSVFLKLIIKGTCSLYEYQYVTHSNFNGVPNTSQPQTMVLFEKENEKISRSVKVCGFKRR